MQARKYLGAGIILLVAVTGAFAANDAASRGERHVMKMHGMHGPGHPPSVEFAAMHNIMAELLSARTGKTTAEIQALFEKGGPHEAFETLGLSHDEVKPLFQQARLTLIDRAAKAGLITAAQAEKLRTAKVEFNHGPMPPVPPVPAVPPVPPDADEDE